MIRGAAKSIEHELAEEKQDCEEVTVRLHELGMEVNGMVDW
jgi:hypothetical protein